jgi:hypothetical protein
MSFAALALLFLRLFDEVKRHRLCNCVAAKSRLMNATTAL